MIWFLIGILLAGLLIMAIISSKPPMASKNRSRRTGRRSGPAKPVDREFVRSKWTTIEQMTKGNGAHLRDAVSEADKLLDYALKGSGARGDTMGERLKSFGSRFSDRNAIWEAHKLRNALAHEADFDLVPSQAREAITSLKQGLKDLGAL